MDIERGIQGLLDSKSSANGKAKEQIFYFIVKSWLILGLCLAFCTQLGLEILALIVASWIIVESLFYLSDWSFSSVNGNDSNSSYLT